MSSNTEEVDQLKARIQELESALREAVKALTQTDSFTITHFSSLVNVLNRTPAQSLAEIQAQALEEFGASYVGKRHWEYVIREINHEATKLRQQAKGE